MTIVGTRPELIKMSRVIDMFDKHTNHIFVHTGQNFSFELNNVFFKDLNIRKPDYFLDVARNNPSHTISKVIEKSYNLMSEQKPHALLVYGDTNSCLSAISAKRLQIPIFHMEAGNRCFDARVPEEINRKIVDHLSDINLVLSDNARNYLIQEGIRTDSIIKTGSHLYEILEFYKSKIEKNKILSQLNLKSKSYFLVSAHREETIDNENKLNNLLETLNEIVKIYNKPIIFSTHPRTKIKLDNFKDFKLDKRIIISKPFAFTEYVKLQKNALSVISDSGTLTEEASILNFTGIMIRETHERLEGMDAGVTIMSGLKKENVIQSIDFVLKQNELGTDNVNLIPDYKRQNVSAHILKIVLSYIDNINQNVWKKK